MSNIKHIHLIGCYTTIKVIYGKICSNNVGCPCSKVRGK